MDKEIFSLEEAAAFLGISSRALRAAAARGEIPGRRIARRWLFSRWALHEWLARSESLHPLAQFAGIFQDSPTFNEVVATIEAESERQRQEAIAQAEAEERRHAA
jgi:excisionase family DNA binding protein